MHFSNQIFVAVLLLLVSAAGTASTQAFQENTATSHAMLKWRNGDFLSGRVIGGDGKTLSWASKDFDSALQLDTTVLDSIVFDRVEEIGASNAYRIQLKNGDLIAGDVISLDEEYLRLDSAQLGEVDLSMEQVESITRQNVANYVLNGVRDLGEWTTNRKSGRWFVTQTGGIRTAKEGTIGWKHKLPDVVRYDFTLTSDTVLNFTVGFGFTMTEARMDDVPKITCWDESIVFIDREANLIELMDTSSRKTPLKRLKLTVLVDRKKGGIVIYDERGNIIGESPCDLGGSRIKPGVLFASHEGNLTVESMLISDGLTNAIQRTVGLQQNDGRSLTGKVVRFDGENWTIKTDDDSKTIAADVFQAACWQLPAARPSLLGAAVVRYQNGTQLSGEVESYSEKVVELKTSCAARPIRCKIDGMGGIRFANSEAEKTQFATSRVLFGKTSLRGSLAKGSNQPDDVIRWNPVGAVKSVRVLAENARYRLIDKKVSVTDSRWGDSLHLLNNDLLPCTITSVDKNGVNFDSFAKVVSVPHDAVRAIELATPKVEMPIPGDDPDWYYSLVKKNPLTSIQKTITVKSPRGKNFRVGHPRLASGSQTNFDFSWNAAASFEFDLLTLVGDLEEKYQGSRVKFMVDDETLSISPGWKSFRAKRRTVHFTIKYFSSRIDVFVNGKRVHSVGITDADRAGQGVAFVVKPSGAVALSVSNCRCTNASERITRFDNEKKVRALTIPRLQKAAPPRQVLCARNGDLLRGNLELLRGDTMKFRSDLDDFRFSRELVGAIVWLHPDVPEQGTDSKKEPLDVATTPNTRQRMQLVLAGGQRVTLDLTSFDGVELFGESAELGLCRIPLEEVIEIRSGEYARDTKASLYADWKAIAAKEVQLEGDCPVDAGAGGGTTSSLVGSTPDDFTFKLADGSEVKLSELRGKVVVLDFWATWCGPCIRALPEVKKTVDSFDSENVVLIAVNQGESIEQIKAFMERRKWDIPAAVDVDSSIGEKFNVSNIPQTVVIDPSGKITALHIGASADLAKKLHSEIEASRTTATK